jgi:hypothetical protein
MKLLFLFIIIISIVAALEDWEIEAFQDLDGRNLVVSTAIKENPDNLLTSEDSMYS